MRHFLLEHQNKKGDLSVTFLVILALLICTASIFTFLTSNTKVKGEISNLGAEITSIYEKQSAEFYLSEVSKDVLVENYFDVLEKGAFVESKEILESRIYGGIKDYFREIDKSIGNNHLFYLKKFILNETQFKSSHVKINEKGLIVDIIGLDLETPGQKINVGYDAVLEVETSFEELGLHSIDDIIDAKLECGLGSANEIKDCFNKKLENFDADVLKKGEDFEVNLVSKRLHVVKGVKDTSSINFVI